MARRALVVAVVTVACVLVGALIGFRLADRAATDTAIGRVAFTIRASLGGEVRGFVPIADWGLSADAIDGPLEVRAELRTLNRAAVARAAEGDPAILSETENEIAAGATDALLQAAGWALACTAILLLAATALWRTLRPRWMLGAAGGALALLAHLGAIGATHWTFDERALEHPTFFARGAELQRILEVAGGQPVTSEYGQTLADVLQSVSLVLDVPDTTAPAPGRELFAASDLHLNALVIEPLSRFVADEPLLMVGDFGQRGGELESQTLPPQIAALSKRVLAVSGNHDTAGFMSALEARGVEVLGVEGRGLEVVGVDGLRVAGFPDPLEWQGIGNPPGRAVTFEDLEDPDAAFTAALDALTTALDATSPPPDLLLVHQNGLAQGLASRLYERGHKQPLTIVTGHDHRQHVDQFGAITVVDGGSVGAGGVFGVGEASAGLARLQFPTDTPHLRAVDLIAIEPVSGAASAVHLPTATLCDGQPVCSVEPSTPMLEPLPD